MTADEAQIDDAQRRRVEAEFLERMQREAINLTVADHLVNILRSLSGLAFLHLGLTEDTVTQRDLPQAKLAIDVFKAITEILADVHPAEEVNLLRSTLSQMQLAYVSELERARKEQEA